MQNKIMRQIDSLKFDPANSRKHDERNIKAIMDSLKMHGQRKPIVIYSDMIVAGNGTVEAAKRLGWSEVWVNNDPFPSLKAAKAFALQDNRSAELAEWDFEQLQETLVELKDDFVLDDLGFNDSFLNVTDDWSSPSNDDDKQTNDKDDSTNDDNDGSVKRIILLYNENDFDLISDLIKKQMKTKKIDDISLLFKELLLKDEDNND